MKGEQTMGEDGIENREQGQALIQVALTLVVLLLFVALAIDVGNAYSKRRLMQNAADAAALAGARELCLGNGPTAASARARQYLLLNDVLDSHIQSDDIQIDDNVVDVTARVAAETYLLNLIGIDNIDVAADAAAACGAATSACGLWPVAFDVTSWDNLYDEGAGCGEKFAVWTGENSKKKGKKKLECDLDQDGVADDDICDCYVCEDDEGEPFRVMATEGRAWLDFSEAVAPYTDACTAPGCGAFELACHLRYDEGAHIVLPTCISGDNGVKAGVKDDVDSRAGDLVNIALYDSLGCETSNCAGGESYHVIRLGCIEVIGWDQHFVLEPQNPALYKTVRGKAIWARVNCSGQCMASCGSTDGRLPDPWELSAVSLIK